MHRSAFLSVRSASWTESWMLSEGTVRGFWEWRSDDREGTLAVVRTGSKEWRMVDSAFGGTVSEAPGKKVEGFYLICILFPGRFLDVISCLLQRLFSFSLQDLFFSCWMSEHSYRTQSVLVVLSVLSSACAASGYGLQPCFHASPDRIYRTCQALVLKLSVLRRFWKGLLC